MGWRWGQRVGEGEMEYRETEEERDRDRQKRKDRFRTGKVAWSRGSFSPVNCCHPFLVKNLATLQSYPPPPNQPTLIPHMQ